MRQSPTCRIYARGLPHLLQRLYSWTGYRFGLFQLAIFDAFANSTSHPCRSLFRPSASTIGDSGPPLRNRSVHDYAAEMASSGRANGTPKSSSNLNPSRSVRAVVTMTTCNPLIRSMEL
jgi:hypothetical protein